MSRKPSEIGVDEYLWAAAQVPSYKELAKFLGVSYGGLHHHLDKKMGIWAEVGSQFVGSENTPGPKPPPIALIEGAGSEDKPSAETILAAVNARYELKRDRAKKKANQHIRFAHGPIAMCFVGDQHFGNGGTDHQRAYDEQQ